MRSRLLAFLLLAVPAAAVAEPVTIEGITFSDEQGGFTILGVSGSGSYDDPFVVVEELTDPEGAVLLVRGPVAKLGNRINTLHLVGFALTKVVVNATGEAWSLFDIELQEVYGIASDYYDGLSFGQSAELRRPFLSDRFAISEYLDEPHDEIRFREGAVPPGDRVTMSFIVTDATPIQEFYLLQRPSRLISWRRTAGHLLAENDRGDSAVGWFPSAVPRAAVRAGALSRAAAAILRTARH